MRYGFTMFATDESIDIVTLARAAEERGFVSLYVPEHTHIPTSRRTPAPAGEPLAEEYKRSLDPFVALAAAAAVTENLTVGTGIALVAQRDPIVMAKEVASLDHLSGGRVTIGIGFGWNREEMADHGVEYARRRAVVAEHVAAMKVLWGEQQIGFDGEFVSFEPSFAWPKPVQRPHPPILLGGGGGPKLFEAIAAYGDGWMPIGGAGVREAMPRLEAAVEGAGRDPATMTVLPFGVLPDPAKMAYYEEVGFDEVVLRLPSAPPEVVLPLLDEYAESLTRQR
jgi:probable F420-dependent oxidoreductase